MLHDRTGFVELGPSPGLAASSAAALWLASIGLRGTARSFAQRYGSGGRSATAGGSIVRGHQATRPGWEAVLKRGQ